MKKLLAGLAAAAVFAVPQGAHAQYSVQVLMSGLDNPRGIALGSDGGIYVAESGRGGNGPGIVSGEGGSVQYGPSGAVSRYLGGTQQRVVTGLPSLATQATGQEGSNATGLHKIAFDGAGNLYGTIGLGAPPADRASLGSVGNLFGHLVRLPLGGSPQSIADLAAYEASANPDAPAAADSNPYGLAVTSTGFVATDAGGNTLLNVAADGTITTRAVFAPRPNNAGFGPPFYQSVPTDVEIGPDGAFYVSELTGFPFSPGTANIVRVDPVTGAQTMAYTGFTNLVDIAFGNDGTLFALQLSTNGLAGPTGPGPGRLIQIDPITNARTTILEDPLFFPGGLTVGPDGTLYVSNLSVAAGGGQVLALTPVPEPGTCLAIAAGLAGLVARRRRKA